MKTYRQLGSRVQTLVLPLFLGALVLWLVIYGWRLYWVSQERKVATAVQRVLTDFAALEFEEGTLAYEDALGDFAARFNALYTENPRLSNGKRALYHTALTQYLMGEYSAALENFERLQQQSPKFYLAPQALYFHALTLEELGQFRDAIGILENYEEFYGVASFLQQEVTLTKARNYAWLEEWKQAETLCQSLLLDVAAAADVLGGVAVTAPRTLAEQQAAVYSDKARELLDLIRITRSSPERTEDAS